MIPSMIPFGSKGVEVFFIQFFDRFEFGWTLCNEGTLPKVGESIGKVVLVSVCFDVGKETFLGNTDKRISNSVSVNTDRERTLLEDLLSSLIVCHEGYARFSILLSNIVLPPINKLDISCSRKEHATY